VRPKSIRGAAWRVEKMGDTCPLCQVFGDLCDMLRERSPEKGRRCWELLLDFLEQKINAEQLADELLKLDQEAVLEWLKKRGGGKEG